MIPTISNPNQTYSEISEKNSHRYSCTDEQKPNVIIPDVHAVSPTLDEPEESTEPDDDDEFEEFGGSAYERTVLVDFPKEAAIAHNVVRIEISIRELLTWLAAKRPDVDRCLLDLRDDFFDGSDGEDHALEVLGGYPCSAEERAEVRRRRASLKRKPMLIQEGECGQCWPFAKEKARLDQESEALFKRVDRLDQLWDQFLIEREAWGSDRQVREDARRAELQEMGRQLACEQERVAEREALLRHKASKRQHLATYGL